MKKFNKVILAIAVIAIGGLTLAATPASSQASVQSTVRVGVVNFRKTVEQSKFGQAEQANFDTMRKQMEEVLKEKEKKLGEMNTKFNDPNYVDSLSPEGEAEAKNEFRQLSQEFSQIQQQYYQMLNQANQKIIQKLAETISEAAGTVAKEKNLDLILNEDASFYFQAALDVTSDVVKALDTIYANRPKDDSAAPAVTK